MHRTLERESAYMMKVIKKAVSQLEARANMYHVGMKTENSSFQGVSEANLHTFLPRFFLGFPSENSTAYGKPLGWRSCRISALYPRAPNHRNLPKMIEDRD